MKKFQLILFIFTAFQFINCKISMDQTPQKTVYDFEMFSIDGKKVKLSDYKGKVLVIVNVASKCGLTPQYADLQEFYENYQSKGVVVLGFPANNFGAQEPGTNDEIQEFCTKNYGVTFPMFSKISVKGEDIHPLYQFLTNQSQNGKIDAPVKWNFQKFIIDRNGNVYASVEPTTSVASPDFLNIIKKLL